MREIPWDQSRHTNLVGAWDLWSRSAPLAIPHHVATATASVSAAAAAAAAAAFRLGCGDREGDDLPCECCGHSRRNGVPEALRVGNDVIRRCDQYEAVTVLGI